MDEITAAYCAGFFDADGCVLSYDHKSPRIELAVTQMDSRPLRLFVQRYGGRVDLGSIQNSGRTFWQWRGCYGRNAASALQDMLPYLTVKKGQAELAIAMQSITPKRGGRKGFAPWEKSNDPWNIAERLAYADAIAEAKHFSYDADGSVS